MRPATAAIADALLVVICGVAGFAATWQAGRIGYFPYDQSIVFDGAWRVLSGQLPWRDFVLPNGVTPMLMQALVFKVSGVSWSAYVLHAAALNAVAAGLVYRFIRGLGQSKRVSFAVGILTAATLYPPVGTPYLETHSLLFSLVAVVCAYRAALRPPSMRAALIVSAAFAAAALSKQIPAVFFVPLAFLLPAFYSQQPAKAVAYTAVGFVIVALALCLVALAAGISGSSFWEHYVSVPLATGDRRSMGFGVLFISAAGDAARALPITTFALVASTVMVFVGAHRRVFVPSWLLVSLWIAVSTWAFAALTNNATEQSLGLLPLAAGLSLTAAISGGSSFARTSIAGILAAIMVGEAVIFHRTVSLSRSTHEMNVEDVGLSTWSADSSVPLAMRNVGFVRWTVPGHYTSAAGAFPELVEFVRSRPENILVVGDETIIYGLTGKPSVTPFLWFHPGLVWENDDRSWREMEDALIRNLDRYNVTKVIVPANVGWAFWQISSFPKLAARVRLLTNCTMVGSYRVCDFSAT